MTNTQLTLTEESLKAVKFRGPTRFADGRGGMAQQDFECVDDPRFGYSWRRESRKDHGRQFYTVDGKEVANLAEACGLLALPEDPESPRALMRRMFDEIKESPKLNFGATRAQNFAKCNADAGPFGTVRAWMQRAGGAWHGGINAYSDIARKCGQAIAIGETYTYERSIFEGDPQSHHWHPECLDYMRELMAAEGGEYEFNAFYEERPTARTGADQ